VGGRGGGGGLGGGIAFVPPQQHLSEPGENKLRVAAEMVRMVMSTPACEDLYGEQDLGWLAALRSDAAVIFSCAGGERGGADARQLRAEPGAVWA
jgi:hypothetical protein